METGYAYFIGIPGSPTPLLSADGVEIIPKISATDTWAQAQARRLSGGSILTKGQFTNVVLKTGSGDGVGNGVIPLEATTGTILSTVPGWLTGLAYNGTTDFNVLNLLMNVTEPVLVQVSKNNLTISGTILQGNAGKYNAPAGSWLGYSNRLQLDRSTAGQSGISPGDTVTVKMRTVAKPGETYVYVWTPQVLTSNAAVALNLPTAGGGSTPTLDPIRGSAVTVRPSWLTRLAYNGTTDFNVLNLLGDVSEAVLIQVSRNNAVITGTILGGNAGKYNAPDGTWLGYTNRLRLDRVAAGQGGISPGDTITIRMSTVANPNESFVYAWTPQALAGNAAVELTLPAGSDATEGTNPSPGNQSLDTYMGTDPTFGAPMFLFLDDPGFTKYRLGPVINGRYAVYEESNYIPGADQKVRFKLNYRSKDNIDKLDGSLTFPVDFPLQIQKFLTGINTPDYYWSSDSVRRHVQKVIFPTT